MPDQPARPYRLVIFFDAAMPDTDCWQGCPRGDDHACRTGFPDGVHVVDHKAKLQGKKDYPVVRYMMRGIRELALTDDRTRFALFTHDAKFWSSAKHQLESKNGHGETDVAFPERNIVSCTLTFAGDDGAEHQRQVTISIVHIHRPKAGKTKEIVIRRCIQKAAELLQECP